MADTFSDRSTSLDSPARAGAAVTANDVKITCAAHTDGKVYIENRRGSSRTFNLTWMG